MDTNVVPGGYVFADMPKCDLPTKPVNVDAAFTEQMKMVGATYIPVLYVGEQVVSGMNYMILCK